MINSIEEAIQHAKSKCPEEICGLIGILNEEFVYVECKNIAKDKKNFFAIDPLCYAKTEDEIGVSYIVHSHPNSNPEPSQADLVSIEKSGLPWLIVNPRTEEYTITEPSDFEAPLIGRKFVFGILDCYTIVKDHYERELNIDMPDPIREDKFWENGENLYIDNAKIAGFERVYELEVNDVILMNVSSDIPNHAAVYLGDNKIMHHIQDRLSSIDVYGGYWKKHTYAIYRHKDFI